MDKANANITIGAQTDKRSFKQTEQETKGFLARLRRGGSAAGGGAGGVDASVDRIDKSVQSMNRMLGIFAAMEVAADGVELAITGIGAAVDAMNGDIAKADAAWVEFTEKAKGSTLIGPGFRIGNMIGELIFGDSADAQKIEEATAQAAAALAKRQATIAAAVSEYNAAIDKAGAASKSAADSLAAATLEGIERDVFTLRQHTAKRSDALAEQIEKFRELSEKLPAQQDRINEQIAALLEAQNQTWEEFNLERVRIEEKYAAEREKKQKELADQLADIETQNRAMMLRLEGDNLEAELVQLRHHYDKRIELAEDAAIREALTRQRALAIEQARENATSAAASANRTPIANPSAPSIVEGLRLTGASRHSAVDYQKIIADRTEASSRARREEAEKELKVQQESRDILAALARNGQNVGGLLAN